jgi:hypothetical protein
VNLWPEDHIAYSILDALYFYLLCRDIDRPNSLLVAVPDILRFFWPHLPGRKGSGVQGQLSADRHPALRRHDSPVSVANWPKSPLPPNRGSRSFLARGQPAGPSRLQRLAGAASIAVKQDQARRWQGVILPQAPVLSPGAPSIARAVGRPFRLRPRLELVAAELRYCISACRKEAATWPAARIKAFALPPNELLYRVIASVGTPKRCFLWEIGCASGRGDEVAGRLSSLSPICCLDFGRCGQIGAV